MKRILFIIGQLRVGGVSKALAELLHVIDGKYDISLLCFDDEGDFLSDVPPSVHILPTTNLLQMTEKSAKDMRKTGIGYAFLRRVLSLITKLLGKKWPVKLLTKMVGTIPGEYDLAISYAHPMPDKMLCNLGPEVVLNCVKASEKAVYIHCDFSAYGGNCAYNRSLLQKFDKVAAVSDSVGQAVIACVPELAHKVYTVRNCHSFEKIRQMADAEAVVYSEGTTFVTIARLSQEKGLLRCIPIFAKLCQEGYCVQWHIVGGGPLEQQLKDEIARYGLENYIVLEGQQINPYRFLKNADYLLLPSFHEAAPVVFDEAAALGVDVITTRTLSAEELVGKRGIGVVCDNTADGLEQAIRQALVREKADIKRTKIPVSNEDAEKGFKILCGDNL